jgi:hypothetical protein
VFPVTLRRLSSNDLDLFRYQLLKYLDDVITPLVN